MVDSFRLMLGKAHSSRSLTMARKKGMKRTQETNVVRRSPKTLPESFFRLFRGNEIIAKLYHRFLLCASSW